MPKRFSAGIHIALKQGGKFLVLRRSNNDEDDPGFWDLPGGSLLLGETPLQAAKRELKEEIGFNRVRFAVKPLYHDASWWGEKWSVELYIEARYIRGTVRLSKEHDGYRWVTKRELFALPQKDLHLQALCRALRDMR